ERVATGRERVYAAARNRITNEQMTNGKPVIGLGTWELAKDGQFANIIIEAQTLKEAAERAIVFVKSEGAH
ncbi:MAG: hypothetical protein KGJ80_13675, partial [Chloroflexota bacterium]|nr:hypothetical protein [Chloroflexota bacterium]